MGQATMEQLTAGHGALTAMRTGRGRDLVLFHALFADRTLFDPLLPLLADHFRVTLFNLPGFHDSEPAMLPLMDAYLARLEDGYQEFDIAPDAVLLGAGFGGLLALAFALDHPERVGKLIVSGTTARLGDDDRARLPQLAEAVAAAKVDPVAHQLAERLYSSSFRARGDVTETCRRTLLAIDPKAMGAACKVLEEADLTPLLGRLEVPTLIVAGADDAMVPAAAQKALAGQIAGGSYHAIDGSGHFPMLEQREAFRAAIARFVGL